MKANHETSTVPASDVECRTPRVWAKVRAAEDYLSSGRRIFCCQHIFAGAMASACTDHLGVGLLCVECMESTTSLGTATTKSGPATNV